MSAQARYTDPSTRSFTGAALWLGLGALVVASVIGTLAGSAATVHRGSPTPINPSAS